MKRTAHTAAGSTRAGGADNEASSILIAALIAAEFPARAPSEIILLNSAGVRSGVLDS